MSRAKSILQRATRAGALVGALMSSIFAQELYGTIDGRPSDFLGHLIPISDIDGDGVADLVSVGTRGQFTDPMPGVNAGAADLHWYSGRTLQAIGGPLFGALNMGDCLAVSSAGDFDGDGYLDIIWHGRGLPGGNDDVAIVVSGLTRQELARFMEPSVHTWAYVLASVGDVNQDGYDDVAVGGLFDPTVDIYLGPTGTLARRHTGFGGTDTSVALLGDLDGDGVSDYAIGSGSASRVTLYSAATGAVLRVDTRPPLQWFGFSLAGVGDVDGDGVPDYAAGAPGSQVINVDESGWYVVSGATGNDIYYREIDDPFLSLGYTVKSGGDLNGDGIQDLIVKPRLGPLYVHSMRTGELLWFRYGDWTPGGPGSGHVRTIDVVGDLDGDGLSEWSFGDWNADYNGNNSGRLWIYYGSPGDADEYCAGTTNSTGSAARLTWSGPLSSNYPVHTFGSYQTFEVVDAPSNSFAQIVYGVAQSGVPFGDGMLCVGGPTLYRFGAPLALDATGHGERDVSWSAGPGATHVAGPGAWSVGSAWGVQAIYRDVGLPGGAGFNTTSAWRLVFLP